MADEILKVQLTKVRLSFAESLYRAKKFGQRGSQGGEGEPSHSANFIIDPDTKQGKINIGRMEDAIDYLLDNYEWKGGKKPKLPEAKLPLRNGDGYDFDGYEGMMFVSASNKKKPTILDIDREPIGEGEDGAPYSGCFVDAIVRVWAQDNDYGKRINASLEGVRFREDGEPFGTKPLDPDDFKDEGDEDDDRGSRSRGSRGSGSRDRDDDRGSRRGERGGDRGSRRRSSDEDSDERDGGRGSSRDRSDSGRRGGSDRSRNRNEDDRGRDEDDDRGSRSRGSRGSDSDDDDRSGRSRRSRGDDDDESERNGRSRSRNDDRDDEKRNSRRGRYDD